MINFRKNILTKKSYRYLLNLYRHIGNISHSKNNDSVICNSFPKSGTHLLFQVLQVLPGIKDWGYFLASTPSVSLSERQPGYIINKLSSLTSFELIGAHVFYNNIVDSFIGKTNFIHYFIYRDPRDVVISEANYLYDMNKFHRLHKYFKLYPNLADRIMFSIQGNAYHKTSANYLNIKDRFEKYRGWLNSNNTFTVKFEELMGPDKDCFINRALDFFIERTNIDVNRNKLFSKVINNINPKNSHTFREGGSGKWKKYFNEEHKKIFKEIAGDLLINLGYEKNYNW